MTRRWLVSIILVSFYLNSLFSFDIHDHNPEIRAAEIEFMQKDAKKPGTILKSGFHYRVLSSGITHWELFLPADWVRRRPHMTSLCECRYKVRTTTGRIVESTDQPTEMIPKELMPGLRDILLAMREGDYVEAILPLSLTRAEGIARNNKIIFEEPVMVFEIELLAVIDETDTMSLTEKILRLSKKKPWATASAALFLVLLLYLWVVDYLEKSHFVNIKNLLGDPHNRTVYLDISIGQTRLNRITIELFSELAPKTVENFRCLCTGERDTYKTKSQKGKKLDFPLHYKNSTFHRVIPGFAAQGGDFTHHTGLGGVSIYGDSFKDEFSKGVISHDRPFLLSMANSGKDTNRSQFFFTFGPCKWLDGKHVVFGIITGGVDSLLEIEKFGSRNGHPRCQIVINDCGEIVNTRKPPSSPPKRGMTHAMKVD